VFSSPFEILLVSEFAEHVKTVATKVWDELHRIERLVAADNTTSELSRINLQAVKEPVPIDYEMLAILEDCQRWHQRTEGYFSVVAAEPARPGAPSRLDAAAPLAYQLNRTARTVQFLRPDVRLDLQSYARAYALDCASHILLQFAVFSAVLRDGAGIVLAVGQDPSEVPWQIPIGDERPDEPQKTTRMPIAHIELTESALVTRRVSSSGNAATACTVVAPTAVQAEILATAISAMGRDRADQFLTQTLTTADGISAAWHLPGPSSSQPMELQWIHPTA
jgi:thiamine biosynthesis lipoprotein